MNEEKKIKIETEKVLARFDLVTQNKIRMAQAVVKENYEKPLRNFNVLNPKYERVWRVAKSEDSGSLTLAYNGTPDKGFITIMPDYRVFALDAEGNIIKEFE